MANLVAGYFEKEVVPADVFSSGVEVAFEGNTFIVPQGYDLYLRHVYGDYMQFPPKEEQVPTHNFEVWDKKN